MHVSRRFRSNLNLNLQEIVDFEKGYTFFTPLDYRVQRGYLSKRIPQSGAMAKNQFEILDQRTWKLFR